MSPWRAENGGEMCLPYGLKATQRGSSSCCRSWSMFNKEADFHGQIQQRIIFVTGACFPSYLDTNFPSPPACKATINLLHYGGDKVVVSESDREPQPWSTTEPLTITNLKLSICLYNSPRMAKHGLVPDCPFCGWGGSNYSGPLHLVLYINNGNMLWRMYPTQSEIVLFLF